MKVALLVLGAVVVVSVSALLWVDNITLAVPKAGFSLTTDGEKWEVAQNVRTGIGAGLPLRDSVDLAIAWAMYECNWGKCTAYLKGNNPWNFHKGSDWNGSVVSAKDTDANGNEYTTDFEAYGSIGEAWNRLVSKLQQGYSEAWGALQVGDLNGLVTGLTHGWGGSARYMEQDPTKYQTGIQGALAKLQDLETSDGA